MGALKDQVIADTLAAVQVVYLDGTTARWWNKRRDKGDTAVFSGWYWIFGTSESGPFKTRSAAIRDAHYEHILHQKAPPIGRFALKGAPGETRARKRRVQHGAAVRP